MIRCSFLLARGNAAPLGLEPLYLGPSPVLLVNDPELIRPILKAPETEVGKGRLIKKLTPVLGQSSLMLHGDEHKRRRAVLHKHMAKGSVERYLPQMCAEIRAVGARLARLGSFDPHRFTATLALRTICIAVFGAQVISSGDEEALIQAVGIIEDDLADEMFRALPLGPFSWYRRNKNRVCAKLAMSTVVQRLRSSAGSTSALKDLRGPRAQRPRSARRNSDIAARRSPHHRIDRGVAIVSHGRPTRLDGRSRRRSS